MNSGHLFSIFFLFLLLLSACGHSSESGNSDSLLDSMPNLNDTVAVRDTTPPEKPRIRFSSAEDALNWMKSQENGERYQSGILPQMAEESLAYVEDIANTEGKGFLIADKASMKVILYDRYGHKIISYPMACSRKYGTKHKHRDNRTPDGCFSIKGVFNSTDWLYTDDDGVTHKTKGVYGPRFIRLKVPNTNAIGIHGTNAPWSVGSRASHGCMRLRNEDISDLASRVETGMVVIISPAPRDMAVNEEEGYSIPSVATTPGGRRVSAADYYASLKKKSSPVPAPADTVPASAPVRITPDTISAPAPTDTDI